MPATELLVSCPDCGQSGFTPRGLAPHRKSKHCRDARKAPAKVIDAKLEVVPAESLALVENGTTSIFAPDPSVPAHNYLHRAAMLSTAQAACFLVLAGAELQRRKKEVGHGNWKTWVADHCEYSYETAVNYMRLAEGVKHKALKDASKGVGADFMALLSTPAHQLSADQQKTLLQSVHKLTDGETVQQLYLDFGIAKKPKRKGGAQTSAGGDSDAPLEKPADWSQEQWDRYLALSPEMRAAVDLWRPTLDFLHRQTTEEETRIPLLPKAERDELHALQRQLGKLLAATK